MTPLPALLTAEEVAAAVHLGPNVIRRWARLGLVPAIRLPGGGPWRFRRDVIETILGGGVQEPPGTDDDALDVAS